MTRPTWQQQVDAGTGLNGVHRSGRHMETWALYDKSGKPVLYMSTNHLTRKINKCGDPDCVCEHCVDSEVIPPHDDNRMFLLEFGGENVWPGGFYFVDKAIYLINRIRRIVHAIDNAPKEQKDPLV